MGKDKFIAKPGDFEIIKMPPKAKPASGTGSKGSTKQSSTGGKKK